MHPLKTSENLFRGLRKGALGTNGLIQNIHNKYFAKKNGVKYINMTECYVLKQKITTITSLIFIFLFVFNLRAIYILLCCSRKGKLNPSVLAEFLYKTDVNIRKIKKQKKSIKFIRDISESPGKYETKYSKVD